MASLDEPLVPGHGSIDEEGPGVDAASKVVEVPKSFTTEVLGRVLTADAVMAVEDDRRLTIHSQEGIVSRLI